MRTQNIRLMLQATLYESTRSKRKKRKQNIMPSERKQQQGKRENTHNSMAEREGERDGIYRLIV